MRVINGKWTNRVGDTLLTPDEFNEFEDTLARIKAFSRGRELSSSKINVLFKIFHTHHSVDSALDTVLSMSNKQLKNIFNV